MSGKSQTDPLPSGYWGHIRKMGCLAILLVGFTGRAHGEVGPTFAVIHSAPEIGTGAAITAFVLAGGGLALLADRIRRQKRSGS